MVVSKNAPSPTPLEAHVEFFDRDRDGIIWPSDTYSGFRALKFGVVLSVLAMLVIHGGFSYVTCDTLLPDPYFRLMTKNIHRAKHGSDSDAYTSTGGFDEKRFDSMFEAYSSDRTHLTWRECIRMMYGNRNMYDPFGWFATLFEWGATYIMLWPGPNGMEKEDVKAIYNGSLFYKISGRKAKS